MNLNSSWDRIKPSRDVEAQTTVDDALTNL